MAAKHEESVKLKDFKVIVNRCDAPEIIRNTQTVTGDSPKIIGQQKEFECSQKPLGLFECRLNKMEKSANLSNQKMFTRRRKSQIEVLIPEPTRGVNKRESGGVSTHKVSQSGNLSVKSRQKKTQIVSESENRSDDCDQTEGEIQIDSNPFGLKRIGLFSFIAFFVALLIYKFEDLLKIKFIDIFNQFKNYYS